MISLLGPEPEGRPVEELAEELAEELPEEEEEEEELPVLLSEEGLEEVPFPEILVTEEDSEE